MMRNNFRRRSLAVISGLAIAAAFFNQLAPDPHAATLPYPTSIAALGDSITRGFNACNSLAECPAVSWAAGTNPTVNSHFQRIALQNSATTVFNDAVIGARIDSLPTQAAVAVSQKVDYVAILMGNNDSCRPTEAEMTSPEAFRAAAQQSMDTLKQGLPNARVVVVGQPDTLSLWQAGKGSLTARTVWATARICQSMLDNPTSTTTIDNDRRLRVSAVIKQYNSIWADICGKYPLCHYNDAVATYQFLLADISNLDFFHPSIQGQATLARLSWTEPTTWPLSGPTASPTPIATPTPTPRPTVSVPPTVGDTNGDGIVNVFDLSLVLSHWGTADAPTDLNHSGSVDVFDLSILLSHWST